jgi:hypothetical protein
MMEVSSLRVNVFIDGVEEDLNAINSKEFTAIVKEVEKLWPDNMFERIWYDIETMRENENGRWDICITVVCYYMPSKEERASIPMECLNRVLDRKIEIFPFVRNMNPNDVGIVRDLRRHIVEVMHVRE